jgi:hypothetical protein
MDMSTLSIAPAFDFRADRTRFVTRRSTVRLTRGGRVVVLLAFLAVAFANIVSAGGWATATHDSGTPEPVRVVEVEPGDTLFGIAGRVAQPGKVREMVLHIQQLNSLPNATLQVGQKLAIPKE